MFTTTPFPRKENFLLHKDECVVSRFGLTGYKPFQPDTSLFSCEVHSFTIGFRQYYFSARMTHILTERL